MTDTKHLLCDHASDDATCLNIFSSTHCNNGWYSHAGTPPLITMLLLFVCSDFLYCCQALWLTPGMTIMTARLCCLPNSLHWPVFVLWWNNCKENWMQLRSTVPDYRKIITSLPGQWRWNQPNKLSCSVSITYAWMRAYKVLGFKNSKSQWNKTEGSNWCIEQ